MQVLGGAQLFDAGVAREHLGEVLAQRASGLAIAAGDVQGSCTTRAVAGQPGEQGVRVLRAKVGVGIGAGAEQLGNFRHGYRVL
ncbi:hypothetical protein D3C84_1230960 [compost metagenome]